MLRRFRKGESWKRSQGQGAVPEAAVQDEGTGMIIVAEIILEGEVGVRVERGMDVTGTERGIIIIVAGVAAPVLIITGGVAGTEALVVAGVAATLLMMTGGVAETVYRLCVEALVVHLAGHRLLVRDLLLSAMMTGLHALVALQHKLNINDRGWMEQDCSYQRLFSCLVVNALQLQTEMPPCLISVAASSCRYCFVDIWMLVRTIFMHDVVKGCWLIKGQQTSYLLLRSILFVLYPLMMMMLVMVMVIMMMMVPFDDADHFAACLHPLLSALVLLTSVSSCRVNDIHSIA